MYMEKFNTVPDKGTFGGSVGVINQNFLLAQQEIEMLEQKSDKSYDPTKHSGLGRKNLKLKEDGSNVLMQTDFDAANTIYVIQYDFVLGEDITIPNGCVLEFDGGSINNGNTQFNITGSVLNDYLNVSNFANTNDITWGLQTCINLCNKIVIEEGNYTIATSISVISNRQIIGMNAKLTCSNIINAFSLHGNNIKIDGVEIVGKTIVSADNPSYLIYSYAGHSNIEICNCSFSKCTGGIFIETNTQNVSIHHCIIKETVYHRNLSAGGYGILLEKPNNSEGTLWSDVEIYSNYINAARHCIYIIDGNHCLIRHNTFVMSFDNRTTDYDCAIMDGGVYNLVIEDNTLDGGVGFYVFTNYKPELLQDKVKISIRNNSINNVTPTSLGAIEFDTTNTTSFEANIENNRVRLSNSHNSGIRLVGNSIDGFTISNNTIIVEEVNHTDKNYIHAVFAICNYGMNNIKIIGNTIINEEDVHCVFFGRVLPPEGVVPVIKNIIIGDNYIDGGMSAIAMHDNYDVESVIIKNNICVNQKYTPIYNNNNTGTTKNIICTGNLLYIHPESSSGIGIDLKVTQGESSVVEHNISYR